MHVCISANRISSLSVAECNADTDTLSLNLQHLIKVSVRSGRKTCCLYEGNCVLQDIPTSQQL